MRLMDAPSVNLSQSDVKTPVECPVTCISMGDNNACIVCMALTSNTILENWKIRRLRSALLCLLWLIFDCCIFFASFSKKDPFLKHFMLAQGSSAKEQFLIVFTWAWNSHVRSGSALQNYPFFRFIWANLCKKRRENFNGKDDDDEQHEIYNLEMGEKLGWVWKTFFERNFIEKLKEY